MAIPKPEPRDWQIANAQELQVTDRQVLAMLRDAKKNVDKVLAELPKGKQEVRRAQLEQTRAKLLAEQADIFERLGNIVEARRARAASRSAGLSAAASNALLELVGKGAEGKYLYESALQVGQRQIDAALARMNLSQLPLSQRIYKSSVWMAGRLGKLINETLATGLNAQEFARRARDWFNPNTPGGVRYAAMRLARTEINNAFHSMTAARAAEEPWVNEVEWNLSKSHPKPDICNEVHAESPFPSDRVPARPHPQCMCYITPKPIDEDEFIDRFIKGEYDDYLDNELAKNGWVEPDNTLPPAPVAPPVGLPSKPMPTSKSAGIPKGDGNPEWTSLEAAGLLEIGSEFLYHGDTKKGYLINPKHVRVDPQPLANAGPKARILTDVETGQKVGQQASSSAKWWVEKIVPNPAEEAATKNPERTDRDEQKVSPPLKEEKTGPVARRNDPEYQKDYNRGWKAGAGRNDLSRADNRGESDAYYDGFSDRSIGAEKWTRADERDEIDQQAKSVDIVDQLVQFDGEGRTEVVGVLRRQAELVPSTLDKLTGITKMSIYEEKALKARFGEDALGGYTSETRSIAIGREVFTAGYERQFRREVSNGFLSKCPHDHEHSGLESFVAHEYGHHIEEVIRFGGNPAMRPVWRAVGEALGITPPSLYDKESVNRWVAKNKTLIARKISKYGSETGGELLAEVWAEYSQSPNPRPHIKAIGDAIKSAVEPSK